MTASPRTGYPLVADRNALNRAAMEVFTRSAVSATRARADKSRTAAEHAAASWGHDTARDIGMLQRAATHPASLSNHPALAHVAMSFLQLLAPISAAAAALSAAVKLDLSGVAQINLPSMTLPVARYIGEAEAIPPIQASSSAGPSLKPARISAIAAISSELAAGSNAEVVIERVLVEAAAVALDQAFLSSNPATAAQPAGIRSGIPALTASGPGEKAEIIVNDIQSLLSSLGPVLGNASPILIGAIDSITALRLRLYGSVPWQLLASSSLPAGTIIALVPSGIAYSVEAPSVEAASSSALHLFDPGQPLADIGGTLVTPIAEIWQQDEIALKLRWPVSFVVRDPRAVAWVSGVNW